MSQSARSRHRAEKALAEGRTPGKPGPKRKYTDEEFREVIKGRNAAYRAEHHDEIREKAKDSYHERKSVPVDGPKKRGRPLKYKTPEEFRLSNNKKARRWREINHEQFVKLLRASQKKTRDARAIAAGRVPGQVGNPKRFTQEQREKSRRESHARYWEKRGGVDEHRKFWRSSQHKRRARILGVGGSYSQTDIEWLFRKQKGKCVFCLKSLRSGFDIDHHIPLVLGGSNDRTNLRLLHRRCNLKKSARHPADHALKNGMLCW